MTNAQYRKAVAAMPQRKFILDRSGRVLHAQIIDPLYGVCIRFMLPHRGDRIEWQDALDLLNHGVGVKGPEVNIKDTPAGRVIFGGDPFQVVLFAYRNDEAPATTALHVHECFHVAVSVLRARNIYLETGSESCEEAYAYYLEFLVRELETMKSDLPKKPVKSSLAKCATSNAKRKVKP